MKILFICGSFEPGKDGVGDYLKRISSELNSRAVEATIVSINDAYVSEMQTGILDGILFFRIPKQMTLKEKEQAFKHIKDKLGSIDWISLQLVSYGLNKRGIVSEYIKPFKRMFNGLKVHVMFHELWVGEDNESSVKMKLLGKVQKYYIFKLLKKIKPAVINTSIPHYRTVLKHYGIEAEISPIFSNIKYTESSYDEFTDKIPSNIFGNRNDFIIGCFFGSIYYSNWNLDTFFNSLIKKAEREGKKVVIASIGRIGFGADYWSKLPSVYKDIQFLTFGQQEEAFISNWLTYFVDFGIITTPIIMAGKSGSYMAFKEHGVPSFFNKNALTFNFKTHNYLDDKSLIQLDDNDEIYIPKRSKPESQISHITECLIERLLYKN